MRKPIFEISGISGISGIFAGVFDGDPGVKSSNGSNGSNGSKRFKGFKGIVLLLFALTLSMGAGLCVGAFKAQPADAANTADAANPTNAAEANEAYRKATGESGGVSGGGSDGGDGEGSTGTSPALPPHKPTLMSEAHAQERSSGGSGEATVGSPQGTEFSETELNTVDLINEFRESNGLKPLKVSEKISVPSARYAHDMAKYDAYSQSAPHITAPSDYYPEGADLKVRMNEEGYSATNYGENIAAGQETAQEVFDSWRTSKEGHREMMLNPDMTAIGVGLVENPETEYEELWVTNFGNKTDSSAKTVEQAREGSGGGSGGSGSGGAGGGSGGGYGRGSTKAVFPVSKEYMGDYSDDWGADRGDRSHEGTDIMTPGGEEIRSVVAGTVKKGAGSNENNYTETGGYNIMVRATESVGPIKEGDSIYYAHMQEPPKVKEGQKVKAGDVLGNVGSTGYGPEVTDDKMPTHLHIGWYDFSGDRAESPTGAMNPYPLLRYADRHVKNAENAENARNSGEPGALPEASEELEVSGRSGRSGAPDEVGGGPRTQKIPQGSQRLKGPQGLTGSQKGQDLVQAAMKYVGAPYDIGGLDPTSCNPRSIDCDCTIYLASKDISLPGTKNLTGDPQQYRNLGRPVNGPPRAGDIIVYEQSGKLANIPGGHVAIATGKGNEIVHAIPPRVEVSADYRDYGPVMAIRRIV